MDGNKIGVRIMQLRDERGESQEDVAKGIGESRETVRNWEVGTRKIKAESIVKLSEYFGVTADYLLGLSDVKTTEKSIQIACDVTGISEDSIFTLTKYDSTDPLDHPCPVLDSLLSNHEFYKALSEAEWAAWAWINKDIEGFEEWNRHHNILLRARGGIVIAGKDASDFHVQRAVDYFRATLLSSLDSIAASCDKQWYPNGHEE